MEKTAKIALVDDHALFRGGLRGLLDMNGQCEVVAEAANGVEFLNMLEEGLTPDIVLLDIDMPGMSGFEVAEAITERFADVKIITLSMHGDEDYYYRMVGLGARGFLLKNSDLDEVLAAIRAVARGGTYFSQQLLTMMVGATLAVHTATEKGEALSERELEILGLICVGLSNQQIGEKLFISKRTVDKHRANILEKTSTRNTAGLVVYALKNGLVKI